MPITGVIHAKNRFYHPCPKKLLLDVISIACNEILNVFLMRDNLKGFCIKIDSLCDNKRM